MNGFRHGFPLHYQGERALRRFAPNLKLECGTREDVWNKVMKEVKAKRFAGPFCEPPFDNFIQSPIGLIPKSGNQGETRLIFHLSYPRDGKSVNSDMPKEYCRVNYKDLNYAIKMCLCEGQGFSKVFRIFKALSVICR